MTAAPPEPCSAGHARRSGRDTLPPLPRRLMAACGDAAPPTPPAIPAGGRWRLLPPFTWPELSGRSSRRAVRRYGPRLPAGGPTALYGEERPTIGQPRAEACGRIVARASRPGWRQGTLALCGLDPTPAARRLPAMGGQGRLMRRGALPGQAPAVRCEHNSMSLERSLEACED